MAVLGATSPNIEQLIFGEDSRLPAVRLIHSLFAVEAGDAFLSLMRKAANGAVSPFILVIEGTLFNDNMCGAGYFSGMGEDNGRPLSITDWVNKLAPLATAVIAIGTCATWGGVPASRGNPTGAISLNEHLGPTFRSTANLPVINIPGCAPPGDSFVETLTYLLLHLSEQVPLELDAENRPAWLYRRHTHPQPAYLSLPIYQTDSVVDCRVPERGWMNHVGGCANVGGACNGCTMPGFPDKFLRLYDER
jgi:hydrogenase small subunit